MAQHVLKTDGPVFQDVIDGIQLCQIRWNDRNFAAGDSILLRETVHTGAEMLPRHSGGFPGASLPGKPLVYTGRTVLVLVVHVLKGYGLQDGWVVLSTKIIRDGVQFHDFVTSRMERFLRVYVPELTEKVKTETAWLVEMDGPKWLGIVDSQADWTTDPDKALRFARKEDADIFKSIWCVTATSTEHTWCDI